MSRLTASWIRQSLGLPSGEEASFTAVTTDSRKVPPGSLFIAIQGEKMDGHDYVDAAIAAGATGVLIHRKLMKPLPPTVQVFQVPETLAAFRSLAGAWRNRFQIPVVLVAGSVGKTTSKEMIAALLRGKWPHVLSTAGSQNGFLGIAITLMGITQETQAAVIEVGIDEPGAMIQHLPIVDPTATLVTTIGAEHLEKLLNLETVAREECLALHEAVRKETHAIVRLDDEWIFKECSALKPIFGFTFSAQMASQYPGSLLGEWDEDSQTLRVTGLSKEVEEFPCPLPGTHNAHNLLGGITLAHAIGLTPSEMRKGLMTFQTLEGRSQLKTLPNGTKVLCDYYNSNPTSLGAALRVLAHLPSPRFLCLGDMLELGPTENELHQGMAQEVLAARPEAVFLYGSRMKHLQSELQSRMPSLTVKHFPELSTLTQELKKILSPSGSLLIKGSRSMKMEEVWKALS